jgi:hypothetical protein
MAVLWVYLCGSLLGSLRGYFLLVNLLVLWVLFIGLFIDNKWQYYGFNYVGLYWDIYGVIFY